LRLAAAAAPLVRELAPLAGIEIDDVLLIAPPTLDSLGAPRQRSGKPAPGRSEKQDAAQKVGNKTR
jgi:hypothetical protein